MAKARISNRYGISYYVHPARYRYGYRGLADWEKEWHRYERRHPTDRHGSPRDEHAQRTISVGDNETLEAIMLQGADGKVSDPLSGILMFGRAADVREDPHRITKLRVDTTQLNPHPDPVGWLRLSIRRKRLARLTAEQWVRLLRDIRTGPSQTEPHRDN